VTFQSSPLFCNHGFRNTCTYNYTIAPYWWMIRPRQCVQRKQYNSQSRLHATVQSNGRERSTVNKRPGSRVFTARCYASAVLAMALCPSVRLSVTSRSSTKTAKRRIAQTTPHDTPKTLVFWCQRSPRNSTGVTPYVGAECRWGGQNRRLSTNSRLYLENGKDRYIAKFLLKSNRKSYALYRMVTLPLTVSAP